MPFKKVPRSATVSCFIVISEIKMQGTEIFDGSKIKYTVSLHWLPRPLQAEVGTTP
jgi:hypothetical protein